MRPTVVALAALVAISAVSAEESDVVVLTDGNFDSSISDGSDWLVEFYAPWCGHCKKLAPTWEQLATEAKGRFKVAKVDCTIEKATATRFGVRGYPTVKFISGGTVYDFKGQRTVDDFTAFVSGGHKTANSSPLPPAGATGAAPTPKPKPTPAPPIGLAEELASLRLRVAEQDRLLAEQREKIARLESTASAQDDGTGGAQADAAPTAAFDSVVVLTDANFDGYVSKGNWLIEFYAPWCGHCKNLAPTWDKLPSEADGKFNVGKVDCTVEKGVAGRFGVQGYPTIKYVVGGAKVYNYQGARTVDDFKKFANGGYQTATSADFPTGAGKAKKAPKPAAEPKAAEPQEAAADVRGDREGVVVLTDANFDGYVGKGNWLVEFYAPWCGHCKNLGPTWDKLPAAAGTKFRVGKLDATVNTAVAKRFGVQGYPTIKLMMGGSKVYEYEGDRSLDSFVQFATSGFKSASGVDFPPAAAKKKPAAKKPAKPASADSGPEPTYPTEALSLVDGNFDATVGAGTWLVKFYAPWCGHCKAMAPTWDELATKTNNKFGVAKVDCTSEKEVGARFGVQGYPTIKLIKDGQVYDYDGPRTIEGFAEFATSGYEKADATDFPEKGSKGTGESAGSGGSGGGSGGGGGGGGGGGCAKCGTPEPDVVSLGDRDPATLPTWELKQILRAKGVNIKDCKEKSDLVRRAIETKDIPEDANVLELTDETFDASVAKGNWLIVFNKEPCDDCKSLAARWGKLATDMKSSTTLKVAKVIKGNSPEVTARFRVTSFPSIKLVSKGNYYDYDGSRTLGDLKYFASSGYKKTEATAIPERGSVPVPAKPVATTAEGSDVVILTDETFDDAVYNGTSDWLVEFYAPWCGHCKNLAPTWEELATSAKGKFSVGKVDCTSEKAVASRFGVQGFPTVKLVSGGMVYEYEGDRTVDAFTQFAAGGYKTATGKPSPGAPSSAGLKDEL